MFVRRRTVLSGLCALKIFLILAGTGFLATCIVHWENLTHATISVTSYLVGKGSLRPPQEPHPSRPFWPWPVPLLFMRIYAHDYSHRTFSRRTSDVEVKLFQWFILYFYDIVLWKNFHSANLKTVCFWICEMSETFPWISQVQQCHWDVTGITTAKFWHSVASFCDWLKNVSNV